MDVGLDTKVTPLEDVYPPKTGYDYICKNTDCGAKAVASTLDEIHKRGKLCPACYRRSNDDKVFGEIPDNILTKRSLAKPVKVRHKKPRQSFKIYKCLDCDHKTLPVHEKPHHCKNCRSKSLILDPDALQHNTMLFGHLLHTNAHFLHENDIINTITKLYTEVPSVLVITNPNEFTPDDKTLIISRLSVDHRKRELDQDISNIITAGKIIFNGGILPDILELIPKNFKVTIRKD